MEVLKDYPSEIEIGTSIDSFKKAMDSQKRLFHSQIDELRNIVVTQCKLTGVNPLSQEMAAGALSINIGKRPRDLLNPKALKYMQDVFSIKDAISKKESREIGLLFGLTVTQVREYFSGQRSRVRKMVRLSREKAIRASIAKEYEDNLALDSNVMLTVDPTPLSSVAPADEAPSCSNQDEVLPGLSDSETRFVETIFSSMCKEETFSGQVKLIEWILQMENPSVLCWFMTKGGVMILATWLSQAANEEQTSVIAVILKVLCHLPLNKALPAHMSAILQGVNNLRFYRTPDISNRARILLSKWSKIFAKSQASKKPNGIRATGVSQQNINLTRRIGGLGSDSWQPSADNFDNTIVPSCGDPDDTRKLETLEAAKLLTTSDESNKKVMLGPTASHNKERRKVQLVEQPGQKAASKSLPVKAVSANQRRPITADEIQKAKLRAQYMQSHKTKAEGPKRPLLTNDLLSASEAYLRPKLEGQKKARLLPPKISKLVDCPPDQKPAFDQKETLLEKCRRVQIPWQAPPEVELTVQIGIGESSKELEVQRNRTRREKETIYTTHQEIPPNPREPWDIEMDYDDTLTPEVPLLQLPDPDDSDAPVNSDVPEIQIQSVEIAGPSISSQAEAEPDPESAPEPEPEPDLELLAVLLKNPDLVFALTSGQASGLSSEDTVRLLDMLKSSGGAALLNGMSEEVRVEVSLPSPTPTRNVQVSLPSPTPPNRFEVSLPSPTPSTNAGPSGWQATQTAKNPFSRHTMGVQDTTLVTPVTTTVITSGRLQNNSYSMQPQFQPSTPSVIPSLNNQTSVPMSRVPEDQPKYYSLGATQNPPSMNSSVSSYTRQTPVLSRLQMQRYPTPEDNSNMGILNDRHILPHNPPYASQVSQSIYNPSIKVGQLGPLWERNGSYYASGRKGHESWSAGNDSPGAASYQPDHRHGLGWSYPDQRERGYGPHPLDRLGRPQNWRGGGGGGGDRRWNGGDRRR